MFEWLKTWTENDQVETCWIEEPIGIEPYRIYRVNRFLAGKRLVGSYRTLRAARIALANVRKRQK